MVDEKTMTARYEIAGRTLVQHELLCGQLQKLSALKDATAVEGKSEGEFTLFMAPEVAIQFLSAVLTEEDGRAITVFLGKIPPTPPIAEEGEPIPFRKVPVRVFMGVLADFFSLNPELGEFLHTWLSATLNLGLKTANGGNGKGPNSGSMLPPVPAEETSANAQPS